MRIKLMSVLGGLIALSVASAPFVLKAQAQVPEQPVPTQTTRQHRGMWDKLNLSDQQKNQMKQIHDDIRNQIKAVLTPEQQAQLETARQNRQANRANQANQANQAGQPRRGRHSGMAALNLTDAQKAKIKAIKQDGKRRVEALLTADQKQQLEQMRQQWQQKRQQRQQQQQNNQ